MNAKNCLQFSYNSIYKLDGRFAVKVSQAFATRMTLVTGAGPYCVTTRALLVGWE